MKARGIADSTLETIRRSGINLNEWLEGFHDTEASVRHTVDVIQHHPLVPHDISVRGFIINSVTGELTAV